jgi:glycosyltransferase involved in cell wall biosynthesis
MSYATESIPPAYGSRTTVESVPAVSIITAYYNTGPIFMETVQSVLAQSLQQWEWVIVNDGSDDRVALAALEPLRLGADPRIRVLDQPNYGLPGARNAAVAASTAPLLFFLDSDDLIEPTALEKMASLLHSDPRPAFVTTWSTGFGAQTYMWPRGFEVGNRFLFENTVTPMVMMRRAVFEAVGGFDATRIYGLEDYEFWLRCAAKGYWGRDIPEFLIHLRRKAPEQYPGYSWPLRDDPSRFRAFLREMRSCYPDLFRQGLPQLPILGEQRYMSAAQFWTKLIPDERQRVAWKLAYRRLAVWSYPLYRVLGSRRLRWVRRPVRRILGLLHTRSSRIRATWIANQQRLFGRTARRPNV